MEWLFRRHFWIVHLAFLALTAIILASVVNVFLEYWLAKTPAVAEKPITQKMQQITSRDFEIANERNLFAAKREPPQPIDGPRLGGNCDRWWESVQTSIPVRLAGTAVFEDANDSLAVIEDVKRGPAQSYSINECPGYLALDDELIAILGPDAAKQSVACNRLDGAVIKRIDPDCVYIYNNSAGRCEFLALGTAKCDASGMPAMPQPPSSPAFAPPKTSPEAIPSAEELGKSIKKTGPNTFEIDGSDLDNILMNLSLLFTQARTVPAFENGKAVGFKFLSIMPDSVFSKIGFEKDDVLTSINGQEMSADKATQLLDKLRTDGQFNVQGKRGGVSFNYEYNIKR